MRQIYEAAKRVGLSSVEGRTFEEWEQKVSDYGLDDARQALLSERERSIAPSAQRARDAAGVAARELADAGYFRFEAEHDDADYRKTVITTAAAIIARHSAAAQTVAPVDEPVDEVQRRMDQVVEAAVGWHQAGREGAEWFDQSIALSAAIDSLLELRACTCCGQAECDCGPRVAPDSKVVDDPCRVCGKCMSHCPHQ